MIRSGKYKCKDGYRPPLVKDMPLPQKSSAEAEMQFMVQARLRQMPKIDKLLDGALTAYLPPSFLVDESNNIIHVINDVNPFTQFQSGRFSNNLLSIINSDLSLFVNNLLRRLKNDGKIVAFENITGVKGLDGLKITLEGRVINVDRNRYFLISFTSEETKFQRKKGRKTTVDVEVEVNARVIELEKELQSSHENLQATVEELETSNEELQSSNEELQSTSEELQSVNEELYTVNSEYQTKIEELTRMTNDLNNLLKNTDVGALYLDKNLCIRKITPIVSKITNILESDIGRPISHIAVMANYPDLIHDVDSVVETLNPSWSRILGWSTEELLEKPWLEFVHPDDKVQTENAKSTIVEGQEVYQFENRYICKDGTVRWLSWNSFPYSDREIILLI